MLKIKTRPTYAWKEIKQLTDTVRLSGRHQNCVMKTMRQTLSHETGVRLYKPNLYTFCYSRYLVFYILFNRSESKHYSLLNNWQFERGIGIELQSKFPFCF